MSDAEKVTLDVRRHPGSKSHDIFPRVGLSHRGVKLILEALEPKGMVRRSGRRWYPGD
jgi:DNA-binding IclR family transcriptional regulator